MSPTLYLLLPAAIFVAIGALIISLGRSVRNGNLEILSGYDADKIINKPGLATWAGSNLTQLGYWQMVAGLLATVNLPAGGGLFFLATVALVGRTVFGSFRFYR
ncbi:hypothetical protein [Hymenobacter sp. YC55]|uniref:hypothetical protein n=1 Tax=Hymenobacter sp. YC55 TaxID=3034019 RepID=UPI0023F6CEC9|nr:hypothetical protein [Hymenobacter sp. YC55]MDF7810305.1 hypothetical protein [Hymenobacter sp. YC55]